MPIYVYRNLTTGETFEVEQRMVDRALTTDPVTGDPVKRLIQPVGIAFKGSGFYVTDSRGKNGASASSNVNGAKPAAKREGDGAAAVTPPAASGGGGGSSAGAANGAAAD